MTFETIESSRDHVDLWKLEHFKILEMIILEI